MKTLTRNETADFLLNNDNYAILTHRRPDGDTIGSSAALCRILRKMGKTAHIIHNAEVSDRFAWLHEGLTKECVEENDTDFQETTRYDGIVSMGDDSDGDGMCDPWVSENGLDSTFESTCKGADKGAFSMLATLL